MKEKMIQFLTRIGKKHKRLVVPIMAVMVVFLTIYHAVKKFLFDVKYHKLRMRTLTVVASLAVVFTLIVLPSLAEQTEDGEDVVYVEEDGSLSQGEGQEGEEVRDEVEASDTNSSQEQENQNQVEETTPIVSETPAEQTQPQDENLDQTVLEQESGLPNMDDVEFEEGSEEEKTKDTGDDVTYDAGESNEKVTSKLERYQAEKQDEPLVATKPTLQLNKTSVEGTYGKMNAAGNEIQVTATKGDAEGETTFQYLWQVKGSDSAVAIQAPGENNKDTYTIPNDIDAGTYTYTCVVTATLSKDGKTASASATSDEVTVTVDKAPLQQTLIDTPKKVLSYDLSKIYYDGKKHGAGVTKQAEYAGIGDVIVKYNDSAEEPSSIGDYTVTVTVSEGTNYQEASTPVKLGTLKLEYWSPESTYKIVGEVSGKDKDDKEWYKESVTINPPSGCKISETNREFKDSLVYGKGTHAVDKIYLQKIPEGYISDAISVDKTINVDLEAPTVEISFQADAVQSVLYRMTGSGSAFRENQKVTVKAKDSASGVKEEGIYYYSTTEGAVDYRSITEQQWIPYEEFNITAKQAENTNYYIYAKAVDYAGNVGYASNEDIILDTVNPEFSVDGNVISSERKFVADSKVIQVKDINLATISVKRADSAEADVSAATEVLPKYDIIEKDGTKSASLELTPPKGTGGVYKYFVTAYDASGNSSQVAIIMVDPVSDVTVSTITFASQIYGYEDDSIGAESFVCTKASGYTEVEDPNITKIEIMETEGTDYDAFVVVDGTKIKPVNRLHAGFYTAKVRVSYNTESSILSTCSFEVKKAQLTAEYRGQDVWYHTTNPDFTNYIYITGFQYGESPANAENMPAEYVAPVIVDFTGPATELGVHPVHLGGGAAKDYDFAYQDGFMTVARRESDRYSILATKGNSLPEEDNAYWYTGAEIQIVPDDGFMLSQDDTDPASFSEKGFVISEDVAKTDFSFYVKNIATGEISNQMIFTYGKDATYPEGKIVLKESGFRDFLNTITFGNLFMDTVKGTIESQDDISGIASVQYCISATPLDDTAIRTYGNWENGESFTITPDQMETAYVYAKITNGAGLVTYVSTQEIAFDTKDPEIIGVSDGGSYTSEDIEITVKDDHLASVTLYEGEDLTADGQAMPVDSTGKSSTFHVAAKDTPKTYTIVAIDGSNNATQATFTIIKPVYEVSMEDKELPTVVYGYDTAPSTLLEVTNTGNANIDTLDVNLGNDKQFQLIDKGNQTYEVAAVKGLPAGQYSTKITVYYNGMNKISATYSLEVKKATLTATYMGEDLNYNMVPDIQGKTSVTGFVGGEEAATAAGYETPTVEFSGVAKETQVLVPKNGRADNYDFQYVKGVLNVTRNAASTGSKGQYTITGTKTESGWYKSDITITPNAGYQLLKREDDEEGFDRIVLTEDTDDGREEFYLKNVATGEIHKKTVFVYMKDVITPVIKGVDHGATYSDGEKSVTVTDTYLASVTVNGTAQPVSNGSCSFTLEAKKDSTVYVIVARDRAGNTLDKTVVMNKKSISVTDTNSTANGTGVDLDSDTAGKISKKAVIVSGAPTAGITSSASDAAKAVLNEDEIKLVGTGKSADIILKVRNIDSTVSQSEKELIIANLQGYTLGQYLDYSVFKSVAGKAEKEMTKLSQNISITTNIPTHLLNTNPNKTRVFAMLMVHNGKVTLLPDQDSVSNTITVFAKKFSTYAIVYKDLKGDAGKKETKNISSNKKGNSSGAGNTSSSSGNVSPATGDTMPIQALFILLAVSFVGIVSGITIKVVSSMKKKGMGSK